jgi:hypothetical protein
MGGMPPGNRPPSGAPGQGGNLGNLFGEGDPLKGGQGQPLKR